MPRRTSRLLLVTAMLLLINLPLLHNAWTQSKVENSGVEVTATLVSNQVLGEADEPRYFLAFRFPREIDPDQTEWTAEVSKPTYDEAVTEKTLAVRVVEDDPAAYRVKGMVTHRLGLLITLVADAILLLVVGFVWRYGKQLGPPAPLRAAAIGDVERCPPGTVLEQLSGTLYLIRGDVVSFDDEEVRLDVGERDVVVVLDGHRNHVGYQQPAQVRARMLE